MHPTLGSRICIIGGSACGKSTLCARLGNIYDLPVTHLDQIYHEPVGNWVPRPRDEFVALHDAVIAQDRWVMDGNYTSTFPQRFERSTAIIDIRMNRFGAAWRWIKRYCDNKTQARPRTGQPEQLAEKFNPIMLWRLVEPQWLDPRRRRKNQQRRTLLNQHRDKLVILRSFQDMERLFPH